MMNVDDEDLRLALGKIDQYRLLEGLYQNALETINTLKMEVDELKGKADNINSSEKPQKMEATSSSSMRRSISITQQLLNEVANKELQHPTEFYQVMLKEKKEEIDLLEKKARDTRIDFEKVQKEKDELLKQIQLLRSAMTENDGRMQELEKRFPETLSNDEKCNCIERKQVLRTLKLIGLSPTPSPQKNKIKLDRGMEGEDIKLLQEDSVEELRKKIDELQMRITELLNHNEKWNALCQGLQEELDFVKAQLLQYQKIEQAFDKEGLLADLRYEIEERKKAETVSLSTKKRVEELEVHVSQLEKRLAAKMQLETEKLESMVAEGVREKILLYEEQVKIMKEDFENELRDHDITRNQLKSLRNQWQTIYKELQTKNGQLPSVIQQLEAKECESRKLQQQLQQAHEDEQLIKSHHHQQQRTIGTNLQHVPITGLSEIPQPEPRVYDFWQNRQVSQWECHRCTFLNQDTTIVCKMCATSRRNGQLTAASSRGYDTCDRISASKSSGIGQLEEDGIVCY